MLEVTNLTAGYNGTPVLHDLRVQFPAGQITVVVGPNGCGKSTLLKALAGILPHCGTVTLRGEALTGLNSQAMARKIAWLPQQRQIPEITVSRLVLHGRFPYLSYPRRYRREDYAAAQAAMERMEVANLADRTLQSLSGGQRQKVYLAMVLAQDTPVILLDEPNTFLDIAHQLQLMQEARRLAREGRTVVLVLHDLTMALEQADRLVLLQTGQLLFQGAPEEVFGTNLLSRAFGLEIRRIQTPEGWKYYYASPQ
ncbi:MAG: ABC transporter ATP-binding protein [Oscillospiraceae bacterium]|nr:ABC transporter ATP-binding protein [Oscillospiraceae bacterium]